MLFGSITQEPLGLPNFHAIFEFLGQLTAGCIHYPKIKLLIILRFGIFIHMPILPNNYILPKVPPLALSKIQRCTGVWSEVKKWSFNGFCFCFALFCFVFDGYVQCKAPEKGVKRNAFFFFAELRSVVVY